MVDATYSLYFRRYSPFKTFGYIPLQGRSEGDNREGASTSLKDTARVTGAVIFDRSGVINSMGYAGKTILHSAIWGDLSKTAHVNTTLTRTGPINGMGCFGFQTSTAAAMPLMPMSPDVNTYLDVRVDFSASRSLRIAGEVKGDNFPNLEVFVICWLSHHSALLLDGHTTGTRDKSPAVRLFGPHSGHVLGRFDQQIPLTERGEIAQNSSIAPIELPDYASSNPAAQFVLK